MSDDIIRLIPTDLRWQPSATAAQSAKAYVAGLFSGPNDSVDEVDLHFYATVRFIDSGVNTSSAACAYCEGKVDLDWFLSVVDERRDNLARLDVAMPCCGRVASLDQLVFDWAVGFASFEIAVLNGTRIGYHLSASELAHVGKLLGHSVRQVLAHY